MSGPALIQVYEPIFRKTFDYNYDMSSRLNAIIDFAVGLLTLTILALLTTQSSDLVQPDLTWLIFILLFVFTSAFAVPLGGGFMSLLPLTTLSALLILGMLQATYVVIFGEVLFGLLRWRFANRLDVAGETSLLQATRLTSANLAIQGLSVLSAGFVYTSLQGLSPLSTFTQADFARLVATVFVYLAINYTLISLYMLMRGLNTFRTFISKLRNLFLFEGLPIFFAPLMSLIYSWLGLQWMTVFALNLAIASLIARSLSKASEGLQKRLRELGTLQAVGQILTSTIHLETVLKEIYRLISELMPADVFYIALYDAPIDQITFPLVIENGKEVRWHARRAGLGLTEYVINNRQSLLLSRKVLEQLQDLGVALVGKQAESWLGAPMLVGDEVIGVIAVQSYTSPGTYTPALEKVLVTIASQAAMAIQNARLYARIDETLERRVRELNSILQTTADGIILMDLDLQILAANPSLGQLLGVDHSTLPGEQILASQESPGQSLLELLGYTAQDLEANLQDLSTGEIETAHKLVQREHQAFRRVLTPVRNRDGLIGGWLLVLNDRTEEQELERMRDDMLHMVVHDLRAPLTTLMGSLAMLRETNARPDHSEPVFFDIAERGSKRMLNLINTILEISRFESGTFSVAPRQHSVQSIIASVMDHLKPAAQDAHVSLVSEIPDELPQICVDGEVIERVLYNLVDNAIKFSPDHSTIRMAARIADNPEWLEVSVSDQGKGIAADVQALLFNKFQRDRKMNARRGGTGLGLYFSRLAVEAHGGRIWVESQLERGSTFCLTLPIVSKRGENDKS